MGGDPSHPNRFRNPWVAIGVIGGGVLMMLLGIALALWLIMPRWLALLTIEYAPRYSMAFAAAARHTDDDSIRIFLMNARTSSRAFRRSGSAFSFDEVGQVAFEGLRSSDPETRKLAGACLISLCYIETHPPWIFHSVPPDVVERLVAMIDAAQGSAYELSFVLQKLDDPRTLALLLATYAQPGSHDRLLIALYAFDDPRVADLFLSLSRQEPLDERVGYGLAAMSAPAAKERLIALATDVQRRNRRITLPHLTKISDARIMPIILAACREMDDDIRTCAFVALTNHGQPEIRAALLTLLADPDENVRYRAAWNLQSYEGTLSDDQRRLINELTRR